MSLDHRPAVPKVATVQPADGSWRTCLLWALTAGVVAAVSLTWPANSFDEQLLLIDPLRMMQGDLPYRDFGTAYGPSHWWLLEGLYRLSSPTVLAERSLGLAVHAVIVGAVYWTAVGLRRGSGSFSAAIAIAILFPLGAAPYAWLTATALCLGGTALLQRAQGRACLTAMAGFVASLALGFRLDAALLMLLSAAPLLRGRVATTRWLLGAALGSAPLLLCLALTGEGAVRDVLRGRGGSALGQSRLPWLPTDSTPALLEALLAFSLVALIISAWLGRDRSFLSAAGLAVASLPEALQRMDETHLLYAALLTATFLPQSLLAIAHHLPPSVGRPTVVARLAAVLALLAGAGSAVVPLAVQIAFTDVPHVEVVRHDGRALAVEPAQAKALRQLMPVLDSLHEPGKRLFVYDANLSRPAITDLAVYYLWPSFVQDGRNLDVAPGASNAPDSGLSDDIGSADVLVLVSISDQARRSLFPFARDGFSRPAETVATSFCHVQQVAFYEVYRRCGAADSSSR